MVRLKLLASRLVLRPGLVTQKVRLPGRLRKPVSPTALQDDFNRSIKIDFVPRRDVKRFDVYPSPDYPPELFTVIQ